MTATHATARFFTRVILGQGNKLYIYIYIYIYIYVFSLDLHPSLLLPTS